MARRKKTSTADDLLELVSLTAWLMEISRLKISHLNSILGWQCRGRYDAAGMDARHLGGSARCQCIHSTP